MVDSQTTVSKLLAIDPQFSDLCKALFGDVVPAEVVWDGLYGQGVVKAMPGMSDVHVLGAAAARAGKLVPARTRSAMPAKQPPTPKPAVSMRPSPVLKAAESDSLEVVWEGTFSKLAPEKQQAFGWASVVEVAGEPVIDLQDDFITPEDLEDAAYRYVRHSRVGGTQHARDDFDRPVRAGDLIESKVWTDEKYDAFAKSIGLDPALFDDAPRGWWVGFQYDDPNTWSDIKKGLKTGFSIHGRGKRVPVVL